MTGLPSPLLPDRLDEPWNGFAAPALTGSVGVCATRAEAAAVATGGFDTIVALTAEASAELLVARVEHLVLEDLYDVRALLAADEAMLALQLAWVRKVDDVATGALPALREAGVAPAGDWAFWLKGVIDRLFRAAFGAAHLLLAARDARLVAFAPAPPVLGPDLIPARQPDVDALAALAPVYGVPLELRPAPAAGSSPARSLRERLPAGAVDVARIVRDHGPGSLLPSPRGALLHAGGYDVGAVVEALGRRGVPTRPLAGGIPRPSRAPRLEGAEDAWRALRALPEFGAPFRWCGADLTPLASPALSTWWHVVVPRLTAATRAARRRFARRRPGGLLVFSPVSIGDSAGLAAARALGVPTVTCQHGGFEGNCEYTTYDLTDLRQADHRLTYGDGITAYLRDRARRASEPLAAIHSVGSARLDRLRRAAPDRDEVRSRLGIGADEPLVFYLPGGYQHRSWYLCRGAYLGTLYLRMLAEVAAVFAAHPGVRVVYKPFPETPADPAIGLLERIPNVTVTNAATPPELFAAADASVLDIPSTALLEALLTDARLLVHCDARFVTLVDEARPLLTRRATLTETPDALLGELERLLADPCATAPPDDDAFLRRYGTHLDDGRSAERAADTVSAIMAGPDGR